VFPGLVVIVQAFLRWAETAKAGDRSRAAAALGRAYLHSAMGAEERKAAGLAITYLLDDPSPRVRLALAESIADSDEAPRPIILALAEDQVEIACTVIARSPVIRESDLVDLIGRGDGMTRRLIASRPHLSRGASAALAEIGDEDEILLLLESDTSSISGVSLRRIAERHGQNHDIRNILLDRNDLPSDARHMLVGHIAASLLNCGLVRSTLARSRIEYVGREADETATVAIAGITPQQEVPALVEHLRASGRLTPAFLIHALCLGKADLVAEAVSVLSGLGERRVRPILATGRLHAVRALFEACGLAKEIASVFVEAVLLWREASAGRSTADVCSRLVEKFSGTEGQHPSVSDMIQMIEKRHRLEMRLNARAFASDMALVA
jgi:uncharacterized protein (DUF2336 family)